MQSIPPSFPRSKNLNKQTDFVGFNEQFGFNYHAMIEFNCVEDTKVLATIKDSIFDKITISRVIEYMDLTDQVEFMKECKRAIATDGVIKIRVPIIRDMMLVDYYGWNNFCDTNIEDEASEFGHACLNNPPKCSFTAFTVTALAHNSGLFVVGASLRELYFHEVILKKFQNVDLFTSKEIAHNIYYCFARRIGTTREIEYWAQCLDDGVTAEEMAYSIR